MYLFRREGILIGGIDYSSSMLEIMSNVLPRESMVECIHGEANTTPVHIKYDAVFCYGVCQYFKDLHYAEQVLKRMMEKSKYAFSMMCIHDTKREKDFLENRRRLDSNYDENYKNLPKLFYPKDFFYDFAKRHHLTVNITKIPLKGFWNDSYTFDCFFL